MCEILFCARNDVDAIDAERDRRKMWKRGYAVVVMPDGHGWGRLESKQVWIAEGNQAADWPSQGRTVLLKIPGAPVAKAQSLLDAQTEDDAGVPTVDERNRPVGHRLRRWRLLVENIPSGIISTLQQDGEVTVTVAQIRAYLKRIRDDAQFTDMD